MKPQSIHIGNQIYEQLKKMAILLHGWQRRSVVIRVVYASNSSVRIFMLNFYIAFRLL
jgi:hypothetical protein